MEENNIETQNLVSGTTWTIDGVKYSAVTDAVLNVDKDEEKVVGIASGKVEATIADAETTPTITLDGSTAFDFEASGDENGLKITNGDNEITYVSGNVNYNANGISFPKGTVEIAVPNSNESLSITNPTNDTTMTSDGIITLAKGTVLENEFADGKSVSITANSDTSGTVQITDDGLKINPASEDSITLEVIGDNERNFTFDEINGEIDYSDGIITLANGTEISGKYSGVDSEYNIKSTGGTSTLDFSNANEMICTPNSGAKLTVDDIEISAGSAIIDSSSSKPQLIFTAGTVADGVTDSESVTLETAGTYTINGNNITTTEDGVEIEMPDKNSVEFDINSAVTVEGHTFSGVDGTKIQISGDDVSLVMYNKGTATLDGQSFELTENVATGVEVSKNTNGVDVSHVVTTAESSEDAGKTLTETVTVENDSNYNVSANSKGISKISGVSNSANVKVTAKLDGSKYTKGRSLEVVTDESGTFNFGINSYTTTEDTEVTFEVSFDSNGNGTVTEVSDLEGGITGNFDDGITVNGTEFDIENNDTAVTITYDGKKFSVDGMENGSSISFDGNNVTVNAEVEEITVNGVTYKTTGDSDGIKIGNNEVSGLDADAQLTVSKAGTYTVNNTKINAEAGDVIIGVTDNYAYISSEDNPQFNANTSTDDILAAFGISDTNVVKLWTKKEEDTKLSDTGENAAIVTEDAEGEKTIELGSKGNAAIIEGTSAPVTVTSGKGADTLVTQGENVIFDMENGGTDKVIATGGKVTLQNYNPDTNAGIRLTIDDVKAGVKFNDGKVQLANNAEVSIENNLVNLYMPDDTEMKVAFATEDVKNLDYSTSKNDLIMVGGGDSLVNDVEGATLRGGAGNDSIISGNGDYIDAGKGSNYVKMSNGGGSTVNYSGGTTTLDNFNFADSDTPDTLQIGSLGINNVKVTDDNVVLNTTGGKIQINDAENKSVILSSQYTNGEINLQVGADELDVKENGLYWAANKNATVKLANYENENANVNINNENYLDKNQLSFRGNIQGIDASGYQYAATLTGSDKANVIKASENDSKIYGGAGNDTFIGGNGTDEFFVGEGRNTIIDFQTGADGDKLNTGESAISSVGVKDNDIVLRMESGNVRIENAVGENFKFENQYTNGNINFQISDKTLNVEGNGLYWAAGNNATVSLANYSAGSANINLGNGDFNDTSKPSFVGNIKAIDATGYDNNAMLIGNSSNNIITAGNGNTTLWGGDGGNDTLIGGAGDDVFWYTKNNGNDTIIGANGDDVVKLTGVTLDDLTKVGTDLFSGSNDIKFELRDGGTLTVKDAQKTGITFEVGGTNYAVDKSSGEWVYR